LLLSRARDLVDLNVQLHRDVSVSEDLDLLVLANGALGHEVVDGHVAARGVELGETLEVHNLVLNAEGVLEPAQLRRTHVRRELSTLETGAHLVAGLSSLGTT